MYKDWIEKSVYVNLYCGRLLAQKNDLEKKMQILQKIAEELIDDGIFNFQEQNSFPMGRSHFNHFIGILSRIANIDREKSIFSISLRKNLGDDANGKTSFEFGRAKE